MTIIFLFIKFFVLKLEVTTNNFILMKYRFLLLMLPLFSFTFSHDDFQKVIDHSSSQSVKNKLVKYEAIGIEREIDLPEYFSYDSLVSIAKSYLGTPHAMGGTTRKGIDCSGLVYVTLKHFGVEMPHSSHEQGRYGQIIPSQEELIPGDLVFFLGSYDSNNLITHTRFYLGDGNYIHASAKSGVIITNIPKSEYWNSKFLFGTRFIKQSVKVEE